MKPMRAVREAQAGGDGAGGGRCERPRRGRGSPARVPLGEPAGQAPASASASGSSAAALAVSEAPARTAVPSRWPGAPRR